MDIELLSRMVAELILDRDEVPIRGLGSLRAEVVPAGFSDKGFTLNPPYRRLTFTFESGSGTPLESLYAKENGMDAESAMSSLTAFGKSLNVKLRTEGSVAFPGLGVLKLSSDRPLFVSDPDLNIFPEGYGLEPVNLKFHDFQPVRPFEAEPAAVPAVQAASAGEPQDADGSRRRIVRTAAVAVAVVLALYALFCLLGRVAPGIVDPFLYSPEELDIVRGL